MGCSSDIFMFKLVFKSAASGSGESLALVSTRRWRRHHSADVPSCTRCLRLINGQLFQCHNSGITIYSTALERVRTIQSGDMGDVFDVTGVQRGQLVVAAWNGLYHIYASGKSFRLMMYFEVCRWPIKCFFNSLIESICVI